MTLFRYQFRNGLENFAAEKYDEAYENFTNALNLNPNLVEAMEKRAMIHFKRNEFEECLIECEEILKLKHSSEIFELKKKAKKEISPDEAWYEVLKIAKDSAKEKVKSVYKELAKTFHPNRAKNAKLNKVDKKKIDAKMAKINRAKKEYDTNKYCAN
jgi:tetratricopeptide (TPR) repeat protein